MSKEPWRGLSVTYGEVIRVIRVIRVVRVVRVLSFSMLNKSY